MATIACVDLDPFLVDLVRSVRPTDEVIEVEPDTLLSGRPPRTGAIVMSASSRATAALGGGPLAERTVLVGVARWDHPGPVLPRPVEAGDLRVALARVLRPPGPLAGMGATMRDLPQSIGLEAVLSVARAATMAAAVVLDATQAGGIRSAWIVAALLLWAAVRVPVRSLSVRLVTADVVVVAAAVMLTGGTGSPYLLVAAVVAAQVGYAYPPRSGATVIAVAALAGITQLAMDMARGQAEALELVAFGSLIPLASLAGVLAGRIERSREDDHLRTLRQLNQTLERLSRQAQEMAGSLSTVTVSEAVLDTAREEFGATAAVLLLDEGEPSRVRTVAGSHGLTSPPPPRVVVDETSGNRDIPTEVVVRLPPGERLVAPLGAGTAERGCLVVVVPDTKRSRGLARRVAELAEEASLALDNARVFEGIRSLTLDDERRRLARDLHDGVVQSLVHVGFELDLLSGQLDDGAKSEAVRLRAVVGQAVDEVRSTVHGLRSVRLGDGLAVALEMLGEEYRNGQIAIHVESSPAVALSPEAELQLLRIAQEAVSNAVQHASPGRVDVLLWANHSHVHMQVSDDGVGMRTRGVSGVAGRGVGLQAMQERAELLGATLTVEPGVQGGTCVRVDVPWGRIRP